MSIQREYIVTLHNFEDLDDFYKDMENPGGSPYIPNRAVPVHLRRNISCNTHYYLTDEEATQLKNDPRVRNVALSLKESNVNVVPDYVQSSDYWSRDPNVASNQEKNWGLLRVTQGVQTPGWGSSFSTQSGTINVPYSGEHVDIVILDQLLDPTHPELTLLPDGTGLSRAVQYNWFQDNPALGLGAAGNYNYSALPESGTPTGHGMHVAGIAAGNTQGWARKANIYNLGAFGENNVQAETVFDYVRYWHNNKPNNPITGRPNPTIVNCSFSWVLTVGIEDISSVVVKGVTYNGPFTANQLSTLGVRIIGSTPNFFAQTLYQESFWDSDVLQCINDGIILVGSASNFGVKIARDSSDPDYNNRIIVGGNPYYYNRGSVSAFHNMLCVGNADYVDPERKFISSGCGPRVDVYAPGTFIMSSYIDSAPTPDPRNSSYKIAKLTGTSMAVPQVTGLLACIMEPLHDLTQAQAVSYIHNYSKTNQLNDDPLGGIQFSYNLQGAPNRYLYADFDVEIVTTVDFPESNLIKNLPITSFTPVSVDSGLEPFTFSVSPALPTGLTLNSLTGQISGTPTTSVNLAEFTLTITDNIGRSTTENFVISTFNQLTTTLTIPNVTLTALETSTPFAPVSSSGGTNIKTFSVSPTLPAGLSLDVTTGIISGTPTETIESETYTIFVNDLIGQVSSKTFTLTVNDGISQISFIFVEGIYVSEQVVENIAGATYTIISGSLPPGLSLTINGYVVGIPEYVINTTGYTAVIRTTDPQGIVKDTTLQFFVQGSNEPVWNTVQGYLPIGPTGEQWALNYQYVNYQLSANAPGFSIAPKKIAIFGDSVSTYGGLIFTPGADPTIESSYISSQIGSISSTIKNLYLPTYEVINISRGGMTTDEALTGVQNYVGPGLPNPFGSSLTITQWIIDNSPDKIILRYGLADAILINNSVTTLNNLQTIIDFAVNRGIEVILIGVNPAAADGDPANSGYFPGYMTSAKESTAEKINDGIINKATSQKLKYANPRTLIKPANSLPDGIHPFLNFGQLITNEISTQLKKQIPQNEQNLPQGYSDLPPPYKLRYFIKDGNGILPPGLRLSEDGLISGFIKDSLVFDGGTDLNQGYDSSEFDIYTYDFAIDAFEINRPPIPKIYTFTVTASDGAAEYDATFNILVVNPEIIRNTGTNVLSIPSNVFTTNTNYVPPIQFISGYNLGEIRSATSQILSIGGYDPYPDLGSVTYSIITSTNILTHLPQQLEFDSTNGYIHGFVPYQPAYTKNYLLTVNAIKTYNSSTATTIRTFDLAVKGLVENSIEWVTSSTLPNLIAGELSEISVKARELTNDYNIKYLLVNGTLPNGISLVQDGSLVGRATTSSIGTVYTATIIASDVFGLSSIEKTFTLNVVGSETEFTQIYCRPFLTPEKRSVYQEFINNDDIFPRKYLYRFYDPNFGVQTDIKMFLEFGIEKLNISEYIPSLYKNFYRKNLYFGNFKIAIANDSNNNPLYEIIYVDAVDTLVNNKGQSISPIVYANNDIVYPNSIENMKKSLRSIVLPDYTLISVNEQFLPKFMKTIQPNKSQITNYISVIPICYALPDNGKKILSRIKGSKFDLKQFNFSVDRLIIQNTLESDTAKYLIFGRQEISNRLPVDKLIVGSDDVILQNDDLNPLER